MQAILAASQPSIRIITPCYHLRRNEPASLQSFISCIIPSFHPPIHFKSENTKLFSSCQLFVLQPKKEKEK
ncbi:unnamed protein product, partial [Vitis vinifera]|uniref:Uncharacterized protein n=1 Tax=Vitis vinifera TaxID=29760 RepID=D7U2D4_VITVI